MFRKSHRILSNLPKNFALSQDFSPVYGTDISKNFHWHNIKQFKMEIFNNKKKKKRKKNLRNS